MRQLSSMACTHYPQTDSYIAPGASNWASDGRGGGCCINFASTSNCARVGRGGRTRSAGGSNAASVGRGGSASAVAAAAVAAARAGSALEGTCFAVGADAGADASAGAGAGAGADAGSDGRSTRPSSPGNTNGAGTLRTVPSTPRTSSVGPASTDLRQDRSVWLYASPPGTSATSTSGTNSVSLVDRNTGECTVVCRSQLASTWEGTGESEARYKPDVTPTR